MAENKKVKFWRIDADELRKSYEELEELRKKEQEIYERMCSDPQNTKICGACKYYRSKAIYDYGSSGICGIYGCWRNFTETCRRWKWDEIERGSLLG